MEILLNQDTRYKKKNGTYPIILRISGNEQTLPISTGYNAPKEFWDEKKREIKKGYKGYGSVSRVNNLLEGKRNTARNVITQLEESGTLGALSIHDVKRCIVSVFRKPDAEKTIDSLRKKNIVASDKKKKELLNHLDELVISGELSSIPLSELPNYFQDLVKAGSVFQFLQKIEGDLRDRGKIGNAIVYGCLAGVLRKYMGEGKDLYFNQLTLEFLEAFEKWNIKRGIKVNSIGNYMRTLRATYNRAVKANEADKHSNPFDDFKIKKEQTAKRAISQDYLRSIINLQLEPTDPLFDARNFFLASFAMQGMSFIDMAFLQKKFVFDGRVRYRRSKTSRVYNVKINDLLRAILEFYSKDKADEDFIFPILRRESMEDRYKDEKQSRKVYNKQLKKLALKCGIKETLTSYVARHTFAMSARLSEVPIEVISQMLGHKDTKTTMIYLDSIPDKTVDDYADKVFAFAKSEGGTT
ncbi:phage integrase SAM-like domain-containing protein [Croceimicrobium sp.]|uniref:phage integrase SAM-like domain-containing protein n=1 Tax=Croceimicrobium sp. TaxID=2828340 RepID=UPI003BA874FB